MHGLAFGPLPAEALLIFPFPNSPDEPRASRGAFSIQNRNWGDKKTLELVVQPEAYLPWRDRALGHLAKDHPDVKRLLLRAEKQTVTIDESVEAKGAAEAGVDMITDVSNPLFEAIKYIINDNVLNRARLSGDGRGLELWRRLHAKWECSAPQVVAAKSKKFQDTIRCIIVLQLWKYFQCGSSLVQRWPVDVIPSQTG